MKRIIINTLIIGTLVAVSGCYAKADKNNDVDGYGEYHAALGVQTDSDNRVYRDSYFDGKNEKDKDFDKLVIGKKGESGYKSLDGKFNDEKIKGNGKYTVSLKNADFKWNRRFRKLYVATDIPNNNKIRFKDIKLVIDGEEIVTYEKAVLDESKSYRDNCVLLLIHPINEKVKDATSNRVVPRNTSNEIKVSFTVSGFDYNKGEKITTPEPTSTPEPAKKVEQKKETKKPVEKNKKIKKVKEKKSELSTEKKVGIGFTVVVAIIANIACAVVVSKRNR